MTVPQVLFYCFTGVTVIQTLYYFGFLFYFLLQKKTSVNANNISISVIICAKNEAENLRKNLSQIINQDYKNFEIVLINDNSSDETLEVMESFSSNHQNISIVNVKPIEHFWGNKKYALTLGIKASKHDFLLFTDADCHPTSKYWIKEMGSRFSNTKSIVLGYGAYKKIAFSFLNKLIRFETLLTAIQYFSYAKMGIPYMGVGRNLAYRKELFFNNSGFMEHMAIKSGDDDLFINTVADKNNTAICLSEESFTVSEPMISFKDWFMQKRRHISTAKYYRPIHKFFLGLYALSQFLFWALAITLFSFLFEWKITLILVGIRVFLQIASVGISAKKLKSADLIVLFPILEIFLIVFQLTIFSANLISKPKHWK